MKRILILMSDTGGGHRASAEALRDAFAERHAGEFRVDVHDLWVEHVPRPLSDVSTAYRFLVDDLPWLYRVMYEVAEKPQILADVMSAAARFLRPFVSRAIRQYDPDLIVSVHPLVQGVVLRALPRREQPSLLVTVVTDLVTIPPVWFDRRATLCFVPSAEAYRLALNAGLRLEQLRQFGLPIRPAFARQPRPRSDLRQELGMLPDTPAALIVSGGEGMGPVGKIAQAVADRLGAEEQVAGRPAGQLAVVCGRNQELRDELSARAWPVPAIITGFVEDIWDWMAACDCIITKAGPGTIAESLALGLPIVLSGYIRGQESGNVPYVLKHGVGVYVEDPWQIAEVISGWFGPQRATLEELGRKARQMGRPQATFEIVDEIARLLQPTA